MFARSPPTVKLEVSLAQSGSGHVTETSTRSLRHSVLRVERHRAEHVDDVVSRDDLPIEVVRWPAESTRRDALAKAGVPRILLVAPDAGVPEVLGVEEDWVRLPADVSDIRARADRVQQLSGHLAGARPFVDPRRVLHRGTLAVQLTPIEASIVTSLLAHAGTVVEHIDLERDVWTSTSPSREALDAAIYRLRRRLTSVGMSITTIRGRGFALILR